MTDSINACCYSYSLAIFEVPIHVAQAALGAVSWASYSLTKPKVVFFFSMYPCALDQTALLFLREPDEILFNYVAKIAPLRSQEVLHIELAKNAWRRIRAFIRVSRCILFFPGIFTLVFLWMYMYVPTKADLTVWAVFGRMDQRILDVMRRGCICFTMRGNVSQWKVVGLSSSLDDVDECGDDVLVFGGYNESVNIYPSTFNAKICKVYWLVLETGHIFVRARMKFV